MCFKIYNPIELEEDKALISGTQGSVFSLLLQSVSSLEMMNDQLVRFCQFIHLFQPHLCQYLKDVLFRPLQKRLCQGEG
eukprot:m.429999 g.429999  ORF g.429999 m.429999 type:complete len:79 (-) comp17104_c0_seq1:115-351(-)